MKTTKVSILHLLPISKLIYIYCGIITGQTTTLMNCLRKWTTEFHVSQSAVKSLLGILNTNLQISLPTDPRTLMQTPRKLNIISTSDVGYYWHQGLGVSLVKKLERIAEPMTVSLNINIDGLPIYKSSTKNFWPILCNLHEFPNIPPVVVGIYYGTSKPKSVTEYLTPFIDELLLLLQRGIVINGHHIVIKIRCFICDTPARSFIKGVVAFNGKFGCIKCTTKGQYSHEARTMIYPNITSAKRTNEKFRAKEYTDHQRFDTPLTKLPIDLIEDVIVADSLHLLELGIMRKLINGWRTGSMTKKAKWSSNEKSSISELLLKVQFPSEIHRRMRSLEFVSLWKGLEYRNFLNYVGIVILQNYLHPRYYEHFLNLFCAVRICSVQKYSSFLPVARTLFNDFISEYKKLYGLEFITSNVHNLCHIVDEVQKFGTLPSLSAYPFENCLYALKKMLRTGHNPLVQVASRLTESNNTESPHRFEPVDRQIKVEQNNERYRIVFPNFVLNTEFKDKWFMTSDFNIVEMQGAAKESLYWKITGRQVLRKYNLFVKPFKSSRLHIFTAKLDYANISSLMTFDTGAVICKLVAINRKEDTVFIPLLHTMK